MADGAAPPRPTGPSERIDAIDVLRGLALLGVVAINVVTIFRVSIFQQFLFPKPPLSLSSIDSAIETILTLAVELKAFALFSLLFGAGLAIQFERLANSERRTSLLVRRLVVLLAFGLIHLCLIWNGDILTEYALAGFIVLPFLFGPRWLLAFAALAFLGLYLKMQVFPPPGLWPGTAAMSQDVVEAHRIYATGGFLDVLAFRLREIPLIAALHAYIFPRTIGLFLLGAFAWRTGILRNPPRHLLFSIAAACIGLGAALILSHAGGFIAGGSIAGGRIGALAESSRHHTAGTGLWRRHHRHRQSQARKEPAWLGSAARTHGIHQLSRAIRHPWLDLLRLWSWPVRPPRRYQRADHRLSPSMPGRSCSAPGGYDVIATARWSGCGAR